MKIGNTVSNPRSTREIVFHELICIICLSMRRCFYFISGSDKKELKLTKSIFFHTALINEFQKQDRKQVK